MPGRHKLVLFRQGDPAFVGVLALVAVVMISALGAAAMMVDGAGSGNRLPAAVGAAGQSTPASTPSPGSASPDAAPSLAPEVPTSPTMMTATSAPPPAPAPSRTLPPSPPAPVVRGYEAESANNTLAGGAVVSPCGVCSAGADVRGLGSTGTLRFNGVTVDGAGSVPVTIAYLNPDAGSRLALLGVGSTYAVWVTFPSTRNRQTVGTVTVTVPLQAGANQLTFLNNFAPAPDIDRITVRAPGT